MPIQKISKEEIVRKCITVFRQRGYYRTNMSDLAKFCGLTKGALYHHFSSKEEVMKSTLEMTSEWFKKHIFSIGYNADVPDDKKLELLLDVYLKTFMHEEGGCFMANTILETSQVEDTFKEIMTDFFAAWEEALCHIFKVKYPEEEAREKSVQTIANLEGAIILMQLKSDETYLKNAVKRCVSLYEGSKSTSNGRN